MTEGCIILLPCRLFKEFKGNILNGFKKFEGLAAAVALVGVEPQTDAVAQLFCNLYKAPGILFGVVPPL